MSDRLENNKVAARYARALFDSTVDSGELQAVTSDLQAIDASLNQVPGFYRYMENPGVPQADKAKLVEEQLGKGANPWVRRLLGLLVENGRMAVFPQLTTQFIELKNRHENTMHAEVVTAVELEEELRERIRRSLESSLGYSRVEIQNKVDPGILGGVIIKVQDKIFDGSYVGRLEDLRKQVGAG